MATEKITIRLEKETRNKINKIAETLNCSYGGRGSVAQLLRAIADNEVIVSKNMSKTLDN